VFKELNHICDKASFLTKLFFNPPTMPLEDFVSVVQVGNIQSYHLRNFQLTVMAREGHFNFEKKIYGHAVDRKRTLIKDPLSVADG